MIDSHTDLASLAEGASLRPHLSALPSAYAPDGKRECNDAFSVKFVRSV